MKKQFLMLPMLGACSLASSRLALSQTYAGRNAPTQVDLRILDRADSLLASPATWNRAGEATCPNDARTWNLYCAVRRASLDLTGSVDPRRAAHTELRTLIDEIVAPRQLDNRLLDYNNAQATTFEDIKRVLRTSKERLRAAMATRTALRKSWPMFPWQDEIEDCAVSDSTVTTGWRYIFEPGFSLQDDGRGVYAPGAEETYGLLDAGFKLQGFLPAAGWRRSDRSRWRDPRNRYFVLDLSRPVVGSEPLPGGVPALTTVLRLTGDSAEVAGGMIRIFFAIDSGRILTPRAIPIGVTVRAARININFRNSGRLYTLIAGEVAESAGACGRFPVFGSYDAARTTAPLIHRLSTNAWRVEMPRGGVAQLYERPPGGAPPQKRGAYFFDASILINRP